MLQQRAIEWYSTGPEDGLVNDNEETLKNKTQKLEHRAFSEAIVKIFRYN